MNLTELLNPLFMRVALSALILFPNHLKANKNTTLLKLKGDGNVKKPERCSPKINTGGNYIENKFYLMGKCQGSGRAPKTIKYYYNNYLRFQVNNYARSSSKNDRSELALAQRIRFFRPLQISFNIRINKNNSISQKPFYFLQLWQCSGTSPIAGLRISQGTDSTINFISRSENKKVSSIGTQTLSKGKWNNLKIKIVPFKKHKYDFSIYINGRLIGKKYVSMGNIGNKLCNSKLKGNNIYSYRIKFGIYKGREPGNYTLDIDNMNVIQRG